MFGLRDDTGGRGESTWERGEGRLASSLLVMP